MKINKRPNPFFILLYIMLFALSALGQPDENSSGKGQFYLVNWVPVQGQDGPYIDQITLSYEYGLLKGELVQRFKLKYKLGDSVVLDEKVYSKEDIGEQAYENIRIDDIVFTAKVYVNDKYVTDISIDYPSIISKSGGESGWYMIKGTEWNNIFEETSELEAKRIMYEGFELKEPVITRISFSSLDSAIIALSDPEGKKGIQKGKVADKKGEEESFITKFLNEYKEKANPKAGLPWRLNLSPGIIYSQYPIFINNTTVVTDTSGNVNKDHETFGQLGGGYGLGGSASFWPYYVNNFGINAGLEGYMTFSPGTNLSYRISGKIRKYIGRNRLKWIWTGKYHYMYSSFNESFIRDFSDKTRESWTTGSEKLHILEFNTGLRLWTGNTLNGWHYDVMFLSQRIFREEAKDRWYVGTTLSAASVNQFKIDLTIIPFFPRLHTQKFNTGADLKNSALLLQINIYKQFDLFERYHKFKVKNERLWN